MPYIKICNVNALFMKGKSLCTFDIELFEVSM